MPTAILTHAETLPQLPSGRIALADSPTPVSAVERFRTAAGIPCDLKLKRDDLLTFGFGGNKVRKMEFYASAAVDAGADVLVSTGGLQSNHARVVAATAARLGMRAVLITNGAQQAEPTANALLARLYGAEHVYVPGREERNPAMAAEVERLTAEGHRPYLVPLGASTPLGALGFVRAVEELRAQVGTPDVIVHAASSGGTCAGLVAGCDLLGMPTRIIGVSADEPEQELRQTVDDILAGLETLLGRPGLASRCAAQYAIDASFVGDGYGAPTPESTDAQRQLARTEAILLDQTYTAKAMAALMTYARDGRIPPTARAVFWHTGGQAGLFK